MKCTRIRMRFHVTCGQRDTAQTNTNTELDQRSLSTCLRVDSSVKGPNRNELHFVSTAEVETPHGVLASAVSSASFSSWFEKHQSPPFAVYCQYLIHTPGEQRAVQLGLDCCCLGRISVDVCRGALFGLVGALRRVESCIWVNGWLCRRREHTLAR